MTVGVIVIVQSDSRNESSGTQQTLLLMCAGGRDGAEAGGERARGRQDGDQAEAHGVRTRQCANTADVYQIHGHYMRW